MKKLSSPIELIKKSVKIFFVKKNLIYFGSIYLALTLIQVLSYVQSYFVNVNSPDFKFTPLIGSIAATGILNFFVYLITAVAGIIAVKSVVDKETLTFKKTFLLAWKKLWKFFLLEILVFFSVFGGIILLIIPGIIFGIWLSFACFVYVDKGLGIKASMGKSRELVKGRFWAVFGRFLVFGLFSALVGFVTSAVPFGIGAALMTLVGPLFMLPYFLLYRELSA